MTARIECNLIDSREHMIMKEDLKRKGSGRGSKECVKYKHDVREALRSRARGDVRST